MIIELINDIHSEINNIESDITKLQEELVKKKEYLNQLRNDNIFNSIFSDSTKKHIEIEVCTNCMEDKNTINPWTNVIVSDGRYSDIKHTIKYPESYKFNSDLKELILKYVNDGATLEDVSIVCENERLRKEVDSLNTEISKLKNKEMWHIEDLKMFNSLSWWKKMKFKFKI